MYCIDCGESLPDRARFCRRCGVPTGDAGQSPQREPETPARPAGDGESRLVWGAATASPSARPIPFSPPSTLAIWVYVALGAVGFFAFVSIFANFNRIDVINDALAGRRVTLATMENADNFVLGATTLLGLAAVGAAILFITWIYRVTRNLEHLQVDLALGPGWSIGSWFIPILNFWFPFRVVSQAWRASVPDRAARAQWRAASPPPLVLGWWGVWTGSALVTLAGGMIMGGDATLQEIRTGDWWTIAGNASAIIAVALAIGVVYVITARQREMYEHLRAHGHEVAAPRPDLAPQDDRRRSPGW